MSAILARTPRIDMIREQWRFRRALLDSLSEGAAFGVELHVRMRDRGFDVDTLRVLLAQLFALEQTGLASYALVPPTRADEQPRRRWAITDAGIHERERLRVP